ncbi:MAG: hypothetical protein NBV67_15535 [Tagaea sp.]|nr:hypothetical protein [Tagaea sp.]
MTEAKIVEIDGQTAILLSPEAAAHLNAKPGGKMHVLDGPAGPVLSTLDPEAARQLGYARELMREFPETFKALAK